MPQEEQKFIDGLVDANKEKDHLSEVDADLLKQVLVDIVSGYLREHRNIQDIKVKLESDFDLAVLDLKALLLEHKFSNGNAQENAELIAKTMKGDFDLVDDGDAIKDDEHLLNEPLRDESDDRFFALQRAIKKHERLGDLLELMLVREDDLASLAPKGKEVEYFQRFRDLYVKMASPPRTVEEWRTSPERKELFAKYIFPFAHKFFNGTLEKKDKL